MNYIRMNRLRSEHRWLDHEIRREERRAHPDIERIRELKRRKLSVKDQLFFAEAGLRPVSA